MLSQQVSRHEIGLALASGDRLPGSDVCEIWLAGVDDCNFPISLLSEEELERHARFQKAIDASRFLAGCAMARLFLGDRLGVDYRAVVIDRTCPRCGAAHGKPRAVDSEWRYSISHSGEYVAVAFSEGWDVGLDIELDGRRRSEEVWAAVLSPRELAVLRAIEPQGQDAAFLRYWTRKEAVLKGTGRGLTVEPRLLEVSGPDQPPAVLSAPEELPEARGFQLRDLQFLPRHVAALALQGPSAGIRVFEVAPVLPR